MSIFHLLLILAAVVCEFMAALNFSGRFNLIAAGLFFFFLSLVVV